MGQQREAQEQDAATRAELIAARSAYDRLVRFTETAALEMEDLHQLDRILLDWQQTAGYT
jgi:hypothetical protein